MKEMQNRFEKHNGLTGPGNRFRDQHVDLASLPEKMCCLLATTLCPCIHPAKGQLGNVSIFENFQVLFSRFNDSYSIH